MLKYQDELLSILNGFDLVNFPHTVMFVGEHGCGKHTLCNYLSEKFDIKQHDITELISLEMISEIESDAQVAFYVVNVSEISVKEQNILLKFLEEPPAQTFIILLVDNVSQIIPTVLNRCIVYEFEKYTAEQLSSFLSDEDKYDIIRYCRTPGDVIEFETSDVSAIQHTCDTMLSFLPEAPTASAMHTYTSKLAFENEQNKLNVSLFLRCLLFTLHDKIISGASLYTEYMLTNELVKTFQIANIKKQPLWENFVIELQRALRSKNET